MKLHLTLICIALVIISAGRALSKVSDLPDRTAQLLQKLLVYETDQAIACDQKIAEAEKSALEVLAQHQDREGKRGDLDTVLALRKIEKIPETGLAATGIPVDSKAVIQKFQAFAKAQRADLARQIEVKQRAVVKVLGQQLKEETRNANIDGAVAIRGEIAKLGITEPPPEKRTSLIDSFRAGPAVGGTLAKILAAPGVIEVTAAKPGPLHAGSASPEKDKKKWENLPSKLIEHGAQVHWPAGGPKGVAEFKVVSPGYVLVACDYSYQGNNSGGWTETRWTTKDFIENGWKELSESQMGGRILKTAEKPLIVFYKKLKVGEGRQLRCNKYGPPLMMTFPQ